MLPSRIPSRASRLSFVCLALACVLLAASAACSGHDTEVAVGGDGAAADPTPRTANATASATDTLLASAEVYAGWRAFNVNCQSCHGFDAVASDVAPDLRHSVGKGGSITHAEFGEVVKKGRMAKGMPAWGALLDGKQIEEIYAYLVARSSGALGAGQPRVGGE